MEFRDLFREKYRIALLAARKNNQEETLAGLLDLCDLFSEQYKKNNGDTILIKAKLCYWKETFEKYAYIIRKFGIGDRRIQKLFGLVDDQNLPSFEDIIKGKGKVDVSEDVGASERISIEGIVPPVSEEVPEEKQIENPIPVEYPQTPVIPLQEKPVYTPESLKGFIGQAHIVKDLLKEVAIAKNEGRKHLDNILLFGNPGLGKTTLMKLIADELGVKFELLDCSQFRNSQQSLKALQNFFMRIARDNEPVVIALDEIHMLTDELQSSLLTLLNNRVYVSPLDVNGQCKRIPIEEFTFIAATTDDDKVLPTIKNRCLRLTFQLIDYTLDELKQIYKNKVMSKGLTITDEAIETCIPRSRGAIRYVNSIVDGLNNALYNDEGVRISTNIDLDLALAYFEEKGIDAIGLDKKDLEILNVIQQENSGVISADVLSARVGLETKKYLSEYERYLIKIGFISVSGRGRSLTDKAINYLKEEK
ncbi:MAG: AAA family ATPase [Roseburia sp.]|nr:AAA family ATPase [Anaeroplasma bactoclasticum]MCM1196773.1 AAA family ATPase [Roseburia sp.]